MPQVDVVLVRPATAANVGATARVIRNTGLSGLVLVAPGDWRTEACWRTAWGAHEVLEEVGEHAELATAVEGAVYTAGFSAREEGEAVCMDVRDLAAEVAGLGDADRVSLVFGPESSGLTLAELAACGRRVRIPTHPAKPSLNLSHAVAIAAYEVHRAATQPGTSTARATHAEKEELLRVLRPGLESLGMLPAPMADRYFREWRRLFQRVDLTPREVAFLEHMGRRMARSGAARAEEGHVAREAETQAAQVGRDPDPFTDIEPTQDGFSLPDLKWRELLFTGVVKREGGLYTRDPERPLPPFERPELLPVGPRFRARHVRGRVHVSRAQED